MVKWLLFVSKLSLCFLALRCAELKQKGYFHSISPVEEAFRAEPFMAVVTPAEVNSHMQIKPQVWKQDTYIAQVLFLRLKGITALI